MPRRAATTIILITRQDLVRADFSGGSSPTLQSLWGQQRPHLHDHASLVEAGLSLGPAAGKQVFVLNSDLWTQTLSLPANRTAGLSAEELANALNFEAESISGLSALESRVAFVPQPYDNGTRTYWIVQTSNMELDIVQDVVNKAGSRLAGIGHPGGVPLGLTPTSARTDEIWRRAELWPDAVLCLRFQPDGGVVVQIVNAAPQLGQWQPVWEAGRGGLPATVHEELLVDSGVEPPVGLGSLKVLRLDDDSGLRTWLTAWAAALAAKAPPVPCLRPAKRPMTTGQRRMLTAAFAILAVIACAAHYTLVEIGLKEGQEQIRAAAEPMQKLNGFQKQLKDRQASLLKDFKKRETVFDKELNEQEKLIWQADNLALQRERLKFFLSCLATCCPEHLVIEKIDNDAIGPVIQGHCWEPQLADDFAGKLSQTLRGHGWTVDTPHKKTGEIVPGGGPCSFSIQLHAAASAMPEPRPTVGKDGTKALP